MEKRKIAAAVVTAGLAAGTALVAPNPAGASTGATTFEITIENISDGFDFSQSGAFSMPDGGSEPGPTFPGSSYEFEVYAHPGDRLSLATMLVQSNDWFFSPGEHGIALYDDDGYPISGDITDSFYVLDAGTEADQVPGEGPDQAPRQSGPNTGAMDPDYNVRVATGAPAVGDLIKVTSHPGSNGAFTINVANVSGTSTLPGPIAPGVFVVHQAPAPLFSLGYPDRGEGLEGLAEDGAAGPLAEKLAYRTGTATPLAPGVFASHSGSDHLVFATDQPDRGQGLEALAEDGDPGPLADHLAYAADGGSGAFTTPTGADGPAPLLPGQDYTFRMTSHPGDRVTINSMMVQSNDWFFGTHEWGVALFCAGVPQSGDITYKFALFDAGTEIDQVPGFGPDQAPRQAGPNTGAHDPDANVRLVARNVSQYIKVTATPVS